MVLRGRSPHVQAYGEHAGRRRRLPRALRTLPVRQWSYEQLTSPLRAFVDGSADRGFRRVEDFNGAEQEGVGGYPVNIVGGVRQNTALAYLTPPVRRRPNLRVLSEVPPRPYSSRTARRAAW
ncbi:GMC family oxidoreductase N-terminal domain-containing protein [Streptomyces mirabilis]